MKIENVELCFENEAIEEIAQVSVELNEEDNIGARRLRTVIDTVMEDLNYSVPDFEETEEMPRIAITKEYVREKSKTLFQNRDFRFYIM